MDPIGFGFAHYDAIGRWQTVDGKQPVDATGSLVATEDADGAFDGAPALGQRLAGSREAQRCMARQWVRFALGRPGRADEGCLVESVAQRPMRAEENIRGASDSAKATFFSCDDSRSTWS